jgi:PAS domain S-box-containing protein
MVTGPDGTIRYLSPSVERVLGYTPEEMVGTSTAEYVHPDDMQRARGELEALLSKPGVHPAAVETRVRHKDGSWRHLEGMATNLLDDPAVEGLVFNQRDGPRQQFFASGYMGARADEPAMKHGIASSPALPYRTVGARDACGRHLAPTAASAHRPTDCMGGQRPARSILRQIGEGAGG